MLFISSVYQWFPIELEPRRPLLHIFDHHRIHTITINNIRPYIISSDVFRTIIIYETDNWIIYTAENIWTKIWVKFLYIRRHLQNNKFIKTFKLIYVTIRTFSQANCMIFLESRCCSKQTVYIYITLNRISLLYYLRLHVISTTRRGLLFNFWVKIFSN